MRDARRARRLSLGEELSLMFLHRAGVRHPSRKFVAPNRYQEDKPRIYKCGGHQHYYIEEATMEIIAGIDVGKQWLDVSVNVGRVKRYANNSEGISEIILMLRTEQVSRAVCEATGGYERDLVQTLRAEGIEIQVAHPNKVRAFAQACGLLAKTDRIDAQVLARYGQVFDQQPCQPVDGEVLKLRDLLRRRQQLITTRVQEMNRLEKPIEGAMRASCERHLIWLNDEIKALNKACEEQLSGEGLSQQATLYQSVRGIGPWTATTLIAELPELGHCNGKSLTALVGLAPWSRDSGQHRGYRSIRGGRAPVRKALYMAALSAIRVEGEMRRFYQGLRKRGKAGKVALVAVMRKLLLLLNVIAHRGTPWVEVYVLPGK